MTKQEKIYLQGEDTIFLNQSSSGGHNGWKKVPQISEFSSSSFELSDECRFLVTSSTSKLWLTITIPHSYMSTSWPIRVSNNITKNLNHIYSTIKSLSILPWTTTLSILRLLAVQVSLITVFQRESGDYLAMRLRRRIL